MVTLTQKNMLTAKVTRSLGATIKHCKANLIGDCDALLNIMTEVAIAVNATPYGEAKAVYVPHGVTAVLFLAESHIILTTWPEHYVVLVDMAFCGNIDPYAALKLMSEKLMGAAVENVTNRTDYIL